MFGASHTGPQKHLLGRCVYIHEFCSPGARSEVSSAAPSVNGGVTDDEESAFVMKAGGGGGNRRSWWAACDTKCCQHMGDAMVYCIF